MNKKHYFVKENTEAQSTRFSSCAVKFLESMHISFFLPPKHKIYKGQRDGRKSSWKTELWYKKP